MHGERIYLFQFLNHYVDKPPLRFPWDWRKPMNYAIIYIYQLYGIITSASCNVSTDSFASGMIVQANAQVQRLGVQLKRVIMIFFILLCYL